MSDFWSLSTPMAGRGPLECQLERLGNSLRRLARPAKVVAACGNRQGRCKGNELSFARLQMRQAETGISDLLHYLLEATQVKAARAVGRKSESPFVPDEVSHLRLVYPRTL